MSSGAGIDNANVRWWTYAASTPLLDALQRDPEGVLAGPGSVARPLAGRKRFYRLDTMGAGVDLFVKVFTVQRGLARLRYWLLPSKARRERALAERIAGLGFDVAAPIAIGEERSLGLLRRSYSVIPARAGRDLRSLLGDPATTNAKRRQICLAFGAWARTLHDAGVDQEDFSPNNFLLLEDGSFALIDFERCHTQRAPLAERGFARLAKLHRHGLGVSRTNRLRLLAAYLAGEDSRAARRRAWQVIRPAFFEQRAHDARHAIAAAQRPGRNLKREGDVWTVRERESVNAIRIELPPTEARHVWLVAHQLERLALPALRPVRLGPGWVELEDPGDAPPPGPDETQRARRAFAGYGRFLRPPTWVGGPGGARLSELADFQVDPGG